MASLKKRLDKLEATIKTQTVRYVITRIIVEPDGTILEAIRRNAKSECDSVSEAELSEVRSSHHK